MTLKTTLEEIAKWESRHYVTASFRDLAHDAREAHELAKAVADHCNDDTAIRAACAKALSHEQVYGSGYSPPLVDVVDALAGKLAALLSERCPKCGGAIEVIQPCDC